jgi:hypothetical protein
MAGSGKVTAWMMPGVYLTDVYAGRDANSYLVDQYNGIDNRELGTRGTTDPGTPLYGSVVDPYGVLAPNNTGGNYGDDVVGQFIGWVDKNTTTYPGVSQGLLSLVVQENPAVPLMLFYFFGAGGFVGRA